MLTKNCGAFGLKAGPDDGLEEGEFIVYPSTFTKTPDSYGDIVAPGAFANTIHNWKMSGNTLPGLFGHRLDDPDYYVAGALDMGEDDHGWWVKGAFDLDSPKGPHVYRLVKGRRLNQLSFAYDVIDAAGIELENGVRAYELRELKVYEFSFVPIGANQDTSVVAVKAIADQMATEIKAGRVISAKNESELRTAHESLGRVLATLDPTDEEKASGKGPSQKAGDDHAADEASSNPSVDASAELDAFALALEIDANA